MSRHFFVGCFLYEMATPFKRHVQGRGSRGGGVALPPPPQLWTVDVIYFLFVFVFERELGSLPKK